MKDFKDLHKNSIIVDAHCDFLTAGLREKRSLKDLSRSGHVDLPRLKEGGVKVQFFAAFISPQERYRALVRAMELIDYFFTGLEECDQEIMIIRDFHELQYVLRQRKIAALLSIEGGEVLAGKLEVLRMLYRLGVRSLTLTWNGRNEIGDGIAEERTGGGLTHFGVEVVKEMNRLGMLIDVSHLSETGFWNVLAVSEKPVIASHSNCRKVCDHPRNLSDEQIKALAKKGGVMGLCFYPRIVHKDNPSLEKLLDHIDHIASVAGVDCIGLGSDFDGFEGHLSGLEDVSYLPALTKCLLGRGYSEDEVRKILGGNFLRVLKEI